ncbi:hypothetical protein PHYBOEH_006791 [Phytophthora boehmeriae]|uniref:Uncharacterized protein n=1 Tax=Phytophthora boehmeriae TaxID=109152 RepID=A0A8T1WCG3_9STRA|nr:hypothetical protein PHYBOEH_006791 [Phytophthora boehmeriae]
MSVDAFFNDQEDNDQEDMKEKDADDVDDGSSKSGHKKEVKKKYDKEAKEDVVGLTTATMALLQKLERECFEGKTV